MKRNYLYIGILMLFLFLLGQIVTQAAIVTTGDVDPNDAMWWTDSIDAYVGYIPENDLFNGTGSVSVTEGDSIVSYRAYLGYDVDSTGTVTISEGGSTWNNGDYLYVGYSGTGTLNITGGGVVVNDNTTRIGYNSNSIGIATVDGEYSAWTNMATFHVGSYGHATLEITNGGTVSNTSCYIGYESGTGEVTVDGEDSNWTSTGSSFYVARKGNATLNINNGGTVTCAGSIFGGFSTGNAAVTVDGVDSTFASSGYLYVGAAGTGMLTIKNGGLASIAGGLTIDNDTDDDSFVNMSDSGMLAILGDVDDSLNDFLDLVGGTDAIRWWDPAVNDWNLLTTATMGTDYTIAYINDGSELDGYTLLTVTAPRRIPGDANCDGQVDASDATILAGNWQATGASWSMGDFNGDGTVDASDATILAGNWQAGTTSNTVPEPGCVALLVTLMVAGGVFVARKLR